MKLNTLKKHTDENSYIIALCFTVLFAMIALWSFTGQWPHLGQGYNSYILQAKAWLDGRLHLGQDYPYLELAIFEGRYYVSFPPFPSILMLPFVMLGFDKCDGIVALISAMTATVYAYKILDHFNIKGQRGFVYTLLLTLGSNWLFTSQNAWVWFIAQNLAFTFSLMAIYYALKGKIGTSLAVWACAVGCRPFQAIYLPVMLYLFYKGEKEKNADITLADIIKSKWMCVIPMAVIALTYMILNYARFGNPIEFGHNYLPEHTRSELGQMHLTYALKNIKNLFHLPNVNFNGKWEYYGAAGSCIFLVSPIFVVWLVYAITALIRKSYDRKLIVLSSATVIVHLFLITLHVAMGGAHFGNRYPNDTLPMAFFCLAATLPRTDKVDGAAYALLMFGLITNVLGSFSYYV